MRSFFHTIAGQELEIEYEILERDEEVGMMGEGVEIVSIRDLEGKTVGLGPEQLQEVEDAALKIIPEDFDEL